MGVDLQNFMNDGDSYLLEIFIFVILPFLLGIVVVIWVDVISFVVVVVEIVFV